ncbi:MAG: M20 family metallo-hydrolase [Candidatus Marsarchaeota archaeon]|jgi:succinyl-diaminopimelate desuccinylase|nr:M20 family metallo-hydrolase [Candidatus Marsarchaeota archaeon]
MNNEIIKNIKDKENEIVELLVNIINIKALSPLNNGKGELERAKFIKDKLEHWGFEVKEYDYIDEANIIRPNLITKYGQNQKTIWLVAHMDTVAEGDSLAWKTDPFKGVVDSGKVYGRGSVDNGQSIVASLYALKTIKEMNIKTQFNIGLALVADEENGSVYGIQKVLNENIFKKGNDLFLVPDWGNGKGDKIEVAEKGILWLKITVFGKQCHASTPQQGVNAYRYAINFLKKADELLHNKYNAKNSLFDPNISTFEMTKHEKNLENINIIPGKEITYIDCRVLPNYKLDNIINDLEMIAKSDEFKDVKINFEALQKEEAAPATSIESEIVKILKHVIKEQYNIDADAIGIGGGTCAAFFRRAGFDAVAWSTSNDDEQAHQPNEHTLIGSIINDTITFAHLFL